MSRPHSSLSEFSILSSLDALSIASTGQSSRRASSASQILHPSSHVSFPRSSLSSDEYEHVFLSQTSDHGLSSPSLSGMEASSLESSHEEAEELRGRKSASAKRRERKKKLIAGEKERAAQGIPSTRALMTTQSEIPHTPKAKQPSHTSHLEQTPGPSTPRPPSSLASSGVLISQSDDLLQPTHRKTRRGGKRARRRVENRGLAIEASEVDDELFADDDTTLPTSSARTSRSGTPVRVSVDQASECSADGASHILDDEEDEVDALSALEDELGTPPSKRMAGSMMSAEDAASSIDSFLSDPRNFMTIKANKLRLWQSLCIELGLVNLAGDELPDLPTVVCAPTPPRPRETTPEPAQPFVPKKHQLPETLTQARRILKDHAHVNLVDYLEARKFCPPAYVGAYQGLLYPSTSAMKKYTRHRGKFAEKELVRAEWLEPLMKDFGVRKAKGLA
ncbi:uncharacterized protein IL334_002461 [Kwoniella shivajii]|uniref:SWIRM domain-containing protein n=1 Tax=Kwoniella shivajii TaxID=564305 RepID=A0ABZ1CUS7_9TREE|nr:hypothetical protein IL334_002461 [Kwoniella shivajii]